MKATFDLPPELIREMKLRAVREGRKLRDLAADLLRRGLASPSSPQAAPPKPQIEIQSNGLPVVRGSSDAPARGMSVIELLALEQATLHQEDSQRLGHAL